jgi:hypothetical protein
MHRAKSGRAGTHRWRESNRPPADENWIWFTRDMLESPAWCAMPLAARKVVERIAIEHLGHAGKCNGELVVTYDDFEAFGVRRSTVIQAIAIATGLGWIDTTKKGYAYGSRKVASEYALTWLPRRDGTPPSNRWKGVLAEDATRTVATYRQRDWRPKRRKASPSPSRNIERSRRSATGEKCDWVESQKCDWHESRKCDRGKIFGCGESERSATGATSKLSHATIRMRFEPQAVRCVRGLRRL